MNQKFEATITEDNGGGLAMYVFDEAGIEGDCVIWAHIDYEYNPGQLSQDINSLLDGDNPVTDWDGGIDNPVESWDEINKHDIGWEIVAQVYDGELHLYNRRMGRAAQIEFGVERD